MGMIFIKWFFFSDWGYYLDHNLSLKDDLWKRSKHSGVLYRGEGGGVRPQAPAAYSLIMFCFSSFEFISPIHYNKSTRFYKRNTKYITKENNARKNNINYRKKKVNKLHYYTFHWTLPRFPPISFPRVEALSVWGAVELRQPRMVSH